MPVTVATDKPGGGHERSGSGVKEGRLQALTAGFVGLQGQLETALTAAQEAMRNSFICPQEGDPLLKPVHPNPPWMGQLCPIPRLSLLAKIWSSAASHS